MWMPYLNIRFYFLEPGLSCRRKDDILDHIYAVQALIDFDEILRIKCIFKRIYLICILNIYSYKYIFYTSLEIEYHNELILMFSHVNNCFYSNL